MNTLTLWDHFYALFVFIVYPVVAWRTFPALIRGVREHGEEGRIAAYRQTIVTVFGFAAVLCALWLMLGREWAALGIRPSAPAQLATGFVLCTVVMLAMAAQFRAMLKSARPANEVLPDPLLTLMPRTSREQNWFRLVSANAGVTEELIFRGYLVWYLSQYFGLIWAAVLAVILFTLAHSYQGVRQVPGLLFISTVLVALYLLSGSLLLPILFHASLDILQGYYIAQLPLRENDRSVS